MPINGFNESRERLRSKVPDIPLVAPARPLRLIARVGRVSVAPGVLDSADGRHAIPASVGVNRQLAFTVKLTSRIAARQRFLHRLIVIEIPLTFGEQKDWLP